MEGRAGWDVKFWSIYWEKSSFSRFACDQTNLMEIQLRYAHAADLAYFIRAFRSTCICNLVF